jgi:hypothetical protein
MTLQMQEAWGDVPVQTVRTNLGHGRRFLFEGAATSDGSWLIGTARPKSRTAEPQDHPPGQSANRLCGPVTRGTRAAGSDPGRSGARR